ncbi:MAG: hypothetical protein KIS78_16295 [Labilithrix sp.]|nr:hypothetical protein [Labilithrix sp.]
MSGQTPMGMQPGFDYGQQPMHLGDAYPRQGPHPTGQSGEFIHRGHPSNRMPPHLGRDNRTMTAQRFKRRPPMWVVAALSCSIALLIAGVVIAIISTTSPGPRAQQGGAATTTTAGAVAGPFTAARTAFTSVVRRAAAGPERDHAAAHGDHAAAAGAHRRADRGRDGAPVVTAPPVVPTTPTVQPTAPPRLRRPRRPRPRRRRLRRPPPRARLRAGPDAEEVHLYWSPHCRLHAPKCDQIIDNGTPLGPGHIFNRPVPSGRHALVLSAPNGVKKTLQVEVVPEQTKEVRISMDKP